MAILAVDASLTSTGYAYRTSGGGLKSGAIIQKEKLGARNMDRLDYILNTLTLHAGAANASMLVIEGYAFAFKGTASRSHSLGELGGLIKYTFWKAGMEIMVVPPNSLKVFMLGRYKTKDAAGKKLKVKELVWAAAEAHAGRSFNTNDQADAYGLLLMGEGYRNPRTMPRLRSDPKWAALEGCDHIQAP